MNDHLKSFANHSAYSAAESQLIKPNVSYCIQENEVHYNPFSYANEYLTFVALENSTFQLATNAVNYSLDNGKTWTELAANTSSPTVTTGNKIMWKGELTPNSSYGIGIFSSSGRFNVEGNAMSLLYGDNFKGQTDLVGKNKAFYRLFDGNTNVINAKNLSLPATTLASSCYRNMFNGCTALTTAPALPATTLADYCYFNMFSVCTSLETTPELQATTLNQYCYYGMFSGCTNLTTAPILPATTLANYCYGWMFNGCTSLTTAPELPATALTENCYYMMFSRCTSLTTAPELPATTLTSNCYAAMFSNCTSLTEAPELPATTLASNCYNYIFNGCTSLTRAPELPATTLASNCYSEMFRGCTSLNYIKAMFTTTPGTKYTNSWVNGVSATGTFVKNSAAQWNVSGVNGIPTGWTVETASE